MIDISDQVRNRQNVRLPDPRLAHQSIEQRIDFIAAYTLDEAVPEDVRTHFETGKNIFVYAWYVYRFHMVAEHHCLATLEMAIRIRLEANRNSYIPRGLAKLLNAARTDGLIANDRFLGRGRWAFERARFRFDLAEIDRMTREGLNESLVDHSGVVASEEDLAYDWLDQFIVSLPDLRNMHAHGSSSLYPTVASTFEIVVELINQLFSKIPAK